MLLLNTGKKKWKIIHKKNVRRGRIKTTDLEITCEDERGIVKRRRKERH